MMRVTKMLYSRATLQMSFFKTLVIGGCLLMLLGCREYKLYHYEKISDEVLGGELEIEVIATRTLAEENGKKSAIEGNPYRLRFRFFSKEKFKNIDIDDLILVGLDSGNKIDLSRASSLEASLFPETEKYSSVVNFRKLKDISLKYETYDLNAVLYLRRLDGETEKSYISYRLKTKYKAESRSDIIDGMMGI
jgi:hypothetical protein